MNSFELYELINNLGLGYGNDIIKGLRLTNIIANNVDNIHHYYNKIFNFNNKEIIKNIEIDENQELTIAENFGFVVMKNDTCIADSLRNGELFEKFLLALISKIIPKDKNMIDIGANIGIWSIIYSSIINKENTIYAFEPQRAIFNCLEKNIKLNQISNILPFNYALSNSNSIAYMNAEYDNLNNFGAFRITNDIHSSKLLINCKIGDELNLDNIGFIKIDVEGHELSVLNGLKKIIKKHMPIIFIEIQQYDEFPDEKIDFFYEIGYKRIYKLSHCDYLVTP